MDGFRRGGFKTRPYGGRDVIMMVPCTRFGMTTADVATVMFRGIIPHDQAFKSQIN